MSRYLLIILSLIYFFLTSCKPENPYEIRNLYIEYQNVPEDIKRQIDVFIENKQDTVYNFAKQNNEKNTIIYKFYDASQLPESNLLDGTRKIRLSLLKEKDSIGNPLYCVELYKSEQSRWKRNWNLGSTPFYSDTLVSNIYI